MPPCANAYIAHLVTLRCAQKAKSYFQSDHMGEEFVPEETTLKYISDSHAAKTDTSQGRF